MLVLWAKSRGFDPRMEQGFLFGGVAQMVERLLCMQKAQGSIPCSSIFVFVEWLHGAMVTRRIPDPKIGGSIPSGVIKKVQKRRRVRVVKEVD